MAVKNIANKTVRQSVRTSYIDKEWLADSSGANC